jgi:hypothetical protein
MALPDARPPISPFSVFKESSCHILFIAGSTSAATHMTSTRSCRGLAGLFIAVRSTSPQNACNSCTIRNCLIASFVQLLFHSLLKRGTILNAEHNATLDMPSENGACHAPACTALPSTYHPSSYRTGHLASAPTSRVPLPRLGVAPYRGRTSSEVIRSTVREFAGESFHSTAMQ